MERQQGDMNVAISNCPHAEVLKAMDICRPAECGILPLPTLGVRPTEKVKLQREMRLPKRLGRGKGCCSWLVE